MSLISDRRRVVALMGLLFAGLLPVRPLRAQETRSPERPFPRPGPNPRRPAAAPNPLCPPVEDFRLEKGSWEVIVDHLSSDALFGSGNAVWRVRNSPIFKVGRQWLMLRGRPVIHLGGENPIASFAVNSESGWGPHGYGPEGDEEGGAIQVDDAPPAIKIDDLESLPIRLFASNQEIGRLTLGEVHAKDFESETRDKLLDALRRDEPIKASVLVDGQELVFFDATPVATNEAIDELRRLVLKRKSQQDFQITHAQQCCFLTTACCEAVGLPDNCFELRELRRYRDQVLRRMPQGPRDIARYYAIAPAILVAIRRKGSERELLRLYFSHILPCAVLAWLGARSLPRLLYADMMTRLCRRHAPAVAGIIAPDV